MTPGKRDLLHALAGLALGSIFMTMAIHIFVVNLFDFTNISRGVSYILHGVNPYAPETRAGDFFNPPFSVIFLWPMLFVGPKVILIIGGALLFAYTFYRRAWASLGFFGTNSILFLIAMGGIDMYVIGSGIVLLSLADYLDNHPPRYHRAIVTVLRVLAYGFLLIKPQGGMFIVALSILAYGDWIAALISLAVYGLPFAGLFPSWVHVLLTAPPLSQTVAAQSIAGKFGLLPALILAIAVVLSRRWDFISLGGALAGILPPYGMPGVPIYLTLTAVKQKRAAVIIMAFSAALAYMTWLADVPLGPDFMNKIGPFMAIYHLGTLGMALVLAMITKPKESLILRPVEAING